MNRREFLEAGLAGVATGLVRQEDVAAAGPVTVVFHFIGLHCRIVVPRWGGKRGHNIVSLRNGGHEPVIIVRSANIAWRRDGSGDGDTATFPLSGQYCLPEAAETGRTWELDDPEKCPRTLSDWRGMSRLYNAQRAGARLQDDWGQHKSIGARFDVNREGDTRLGEFMGEPPIKPEDRRAVWRIGDARQALTDRFAYRVRTAKPTILDEQGPLIVLKEATSAEIVPVYVVTTMPAVEKTGLGKAYEKGDTLAHSKLGHGLLDGPKPNPEFVENCCACEEAEVAEAAKVDPWVAQAVSHMIARLTHERDHGRVSSSLDTFCPGFDMS